MAVFTFAWAKFLLFSQFVPNPREFYTRNICNGTPDWRALDILLAAVELCEAVTSLWKWSIMRVCSSVNYSFSSRWMASNMVEIEPGLACLCECQDITRIAVPRVKGGHVWMDPGRSGIEPGSLCLCERGKGRLVTQDYEHQWVANLSIRVWYLRSSDYVHMHVACYGLLILLMMHAIFYPLACQYWGVHRRCTCRAAWRGPHPVQQHPLHPWCWRGRGGRGNERLAARTCRTLLTAGVSFHGKLHMHV